MNILSLAGVDFTEKRVALRVDFNVELDSQGDIKEKFKMASCKKTIEYLLSFSGVRVGLLSHLGRPDGRPDPNVSLSRISDDIARVLGYDVTFVPSCVGDPVVQALRQAPEKSLLLLENVRFEEGEEAADKDFAERLAEPFDVFVNDAFSVCHRDQASVTGIATLLPSYAGYHLFEEIERLEKIRTNPDHPAVAIIGGAKIQTKLPLIEAFARLYDVVLVGGKIANEAIDGEYVFGPNVVLPLDFIGDRFDIGPKTVELFLQKMQSAKTIVWNGPMGKFEDPLYAQGTQRIARAMAQSDSFTLVGGGESVEVLEKLDLMEEISFVSTGGGAMLDFLSNNPMPGIDLLRGTANRA